MSLEETGVITVSALQQPMLAETSFAATPNPYWGYP